MSFLATLPWEVRCLINDCMPEELTQLCRLVAREERTRRWCRLGIPAGDSVDGVDGVQEGERCRTSVTSVWEAQSQWSDSCRRWAVDMERAKTSPIVSHAHQGLARLLRRWPHRHPVVGLLSAMRLLRARAALLARGLPWRVTPGQFHASDDTAPIEVQLTWPCGWHDITPRMHRVHLVDNIPKARRVALAGCSGVLELVVSCAVVGPKMLRHCTSLSRVLLQHGVTEIHASTFYGCECLAEVVIPSSVTRIGPDAFAGCTALTAVRIPSSVTEIGHHAFVGCSLSDIVLPGSVRLGEAAFMRCNSLRSVVLREGALRIPERAFSRCAALRHVVVPPSVIGVGGFAFIECTALQAIALSGVLEIGSHAFYRCTGLVEITVRAREVSEAAFGSCDRLERVLLMPGIIEIHARAFERCPRLLEVTIPSTVSCVRESAFWRCTSLASVVLQGSDTKVHPSSLAWCADSLDTVVNAGDNREWTRKQNEIWYECA
jgi:hypothetical protein